jgi:hypothetical protein
MAHNLDFKTCLPVDENSTRLNSLIDKIKTILEVLCDIFFMPIVYIHYLVDKFLRKEKLKNTHSARALQIREGNDTIFLIFRWKFTPLLGKLYDKNNDNVIIKYVLLGIQVRFLLQRSRCASRYEMQENLDSLKHYNCPSKASGWPR